MKHKIYITSLFICLSLFVSCTFDTKGKKIGLYDNPRKALLILDIQNDFTSINAKMAVDKKQSITMINNINRLITSAGKNNVEIIYIKNEFSKKDYIGNLFRNNAAIKGTIGSHFDERLIIGSHNIFKKSKPDAFSNKDLEEFLIDKQIDEIYVTGVFADQCVYWTSKGALNRSYKVKYVQDAVASKSDQTIKKVVEEIRGYGAIIVTSDKVFR